MYPGIVLSDYGTGRSVFYAFDLSMSLSEGNLAEYSDLLAASVGYVHKAIDSSNLHPYGLVPYDLTVSSPGRGFALNLDVSYPMEMTILDSQTDSWVASNPWSFDLNVPSGETAIVPYSILLPDLYGTFTLSVESGFTETDTYTFLQNEVFEIGMDQDSNDLINTIIDDVSVLQLDGQDSAKGLDIITSLVNVQTNTINGEGDIQTNIHEILQAIDSLLLIESVDMSDIRRKLNTLLRIEQGRYYFYEGP